MSTNLNVSSAPRLHDPSQPPPAPGTGATSSKPPPIPWHRNQSQAMEGKNAFISERPLDVQPAPGGGVAIGGGHPNLPERQATLAEKIRGKAEQVIGKATNNPELHERGELRETGGNAAAEGRARAAHD